MATAQVVASHKKLSLVEQAFRNLKTVRLEVRPVFHKKDARMRAHVFLCLLAYYVQWQAQQRLQPLLAGDGAGKKRQRTFENVIAHLTTIRSNRVKTNGAEFQLRTHAESDQQKILTLLSEKQPEP